MGRDYTQGAILYKRGTPREKNYIKRDYTTQWENYMGKRLYREELHREKLHREENTVYKKKTIRRETIQRETI